MNKPQTPVRRALRRDQSLRFEHLRGLCLRAEQGALWVTVDGEPDDITIEPGACRVFDGEQGLLVGTFRGEALLSASMLHAVPRWRSWLGLAPLQPVSAA